MSNFKVIMMVFLAGMALSWGCSVHKPQVVSFKNPVPSAKNLQEILKKPRKISLITMKTGEVKVGRDLLLNMNSQKTKVLKNEEIWVPVMAHLVKHSSGDYLVDSGFDETFARSGSGNFGCLARFFNFGRQNPGQDIAAQLKKHGAKPRGVFFTHLHGDHTAGIPALPNNIVYVAGKGSLKDSYDDVFGVCADHFKGKKELSEIDFSRAVDLSPLGRGVDLLGDGSFWAIHTPGHSAGHISYLINGSSPILLTGDVSHTEWGFQKGVEPGKVVHREQAVQSLESLRKFSRRFPKVKIIYGHEDPR